MNDAHAASVTYLSSLFIRQQVTVQTTINCAPTKQLQRKQLYDVSMHAHAVSRFDVKSSSGVRKPNCGLRW